MADNLAYDLSLFENRERKAKAVPKQLPKALPTSRLRTGVVVLGRICVGIFVGLVLCAGIYSRVALTEAVQDIGVAKAKLEQLQNENTRLNVELDSKVSIKSIEAYATGTLGLNRAEKYQINYITLSGDDKIEANQVHSQQSRGIPNINELFYRLVEYIN